MLGLGSSETGVVLKGELDLAYWTACKFDLNPFPRAVSSDHEMAS